MNRCNDISYALLGTGMNAGSSALAAHIANYPMGALGGGIFGVVRTVAQIGLALGIGQIVDLDDPYTSTATKVVVKAVEILGSFGAAWGVLALAGIVVTLPQIIGLAVLSIITDVIVGCACACITIYVEQSWQYEIHSSQKSQDSRNAAVLAGLIGAMPRRVNG